MWVLEFDYSAIDDSEMEEVHEEVAEYVLANPEVSYFESRNIVVCEELDIALQLKMNFSEHVVAIEQI